MYVPGEFSDVPEIRKTEDLGYLPFYSEDDRVRLVFGVPRKLPLPTRIGTLERHSTFAEEYRAGSPSDFLSMNGLEDLFLDRVFQLVPKMAFLADGVSFDVDFDKDVLRGEITPERMSAYWEWRAEMIRAGRQSVGVPYLLRLTRREVSELVYLAYAYGGEADGPAAYRAALRANPDILVPIPDGRMETELGRRVEAELKAPPEAAAPPPEAAEPPEPPAPEPLSKEEFVRLWVGRQLTPLQIGTEMQRYSMQEQEELEEAWRQGVRKRDAAIPKP